MQNGFEFPAARSSFAGAARAVSDLWRDADQFICVHIAGERILVLIMRSRNALMHHMGVHTVAPALNHDSPRALSHRIKIGDTLKQHSP